MTTFKLEAGRNIYRDGKPFIAIMRCGDTTPCEADEAAREIAATVYRCDYNGLIADKYEGAKKNAEGWYQSIQELVARLNSEDDKSRIGSCPGRNGHQSPTTQAIATPC
jgi:hypothetical protein